MVTLQFEPRRGGGGQLPNVLRRRSFGGCSQILSLVAQRVTVCDLQFQNDASIKPKTILLQGHCLFIT